MGLGGFALLRANASATAPCVPVKPLGYVGPYGSVQDAQDAWWNDPDTSLITSLFDNIVTRVCCSYSYVTWIEGTGGLNNPGEPMIGHYENKWAEVCNFYYKK